ncbi:CheY-P-specific phosphatase CheC [Iocasia frigidifontis]|uniref:CheY-P-specific phosphatase CheC n=1 Tax=Iocasia fonsfrigidae TaxID=2682810 RepID=A0A8A7KFZ1_9FIRM|nr:MULTISPECIES: chemotaxis protein CheC [Halanaerobiaceae]AZO95560.1 chemotaxis protein CheC [Halocella sp. SP3-1]QTL98429.1 CheY-P-specific phosphatase CheC [Iocasia fonsfrigidae]
MSGDLIENITSMQKDALKEIGNIGAGNAATAFAQVLDTEIDMTVPSVDITPISEVPEVTGQIEQKVVSVLLKVMGEAPGSILLILSEESSKNLLSIMMNNGSEIEDFTEVEISALKEIGNILSGSYLNAINQMTGLNLIQSIPGFSYDMAGAILTTSMISLFEESDYALLIETKFINNGKEIEGYFFYIPDSGSLEKILKALGFDTK